MIDNEEVIPSLLLVFTSSASTVKVGVGPIIVVEVVDVLVEVLVEVLVDVLVEVLVDVLVEVVVELEVVVTGLTEPPLPQPNKGIIVMANIDKMITLELIFMQFYLNSRGFLVLLKLL